MTIIRHLEDDDKSRCVPFAPFSTEGMPPVWSKVSRRHNEKLLKAALYRDNLDIIIPS